VTGVSRLPFPAVSDAQCLVERKVRPPRQVEIQVEGRWWPGVQRGWRMYADGTGWRAVVTFVAAGPGGLASHDADVPVERLRVVG
jgi:hypothetical protein